MIYLVLSILTASSLLIFFKLFEKYKVNAPLAIAINYLAAAVVGLFYLKGNILPISAHWDWISISCTLGFMFSIIFNLSRYTTQKIGMGITSVAMKLGVVFPVLIGILFYGEQFTALNYLGLGLGFISIYFINKPSQNNDIQETKYIYLLPLLVWIGSGVCDSAVQLIQIKFPTPASDGSFSFLAFLSAAISSISFVIYRRTPWDIRSILGGIALGVPNYYSIFFLVKALQEMKLQYQMDSSNLFMVNNLSIVICSVAIGLLFFKEKLNRWNVLGIVLSLISLYMINIK